MENELNSSSINNERCSYKEFLHIAVNLFEGIRTANAFWKILQQFNENVKSYNDEMNYSPAFYKTIYLSLVESLYISLSRLYDWNKDSLTLRVLLDNKAHITENYLDKDVKEKYLLNNNKFHKILNIYEEPFFKKDVEDTKRICEMMEVKYCKTTVDLSLDEVMQLFDKRFKALQDRGVIKNLMKQRSKIHAHNDKIVNFDFDSIWKEFPLSELDVCELIDFAADFLQFCIEILTGVHKVVDYVNIDDWRATLEIVRAGMACRKEYLQKLEFES